MALTLLLALPGAALAQSAGDDQYSDPFGENQDGGQSSGGDTSTDSGDTGSTGGNSGGDDAPVASEPDDGSTAPETTTTAAPAAESGGGELPRTGLEIVLLLATAFPLLVAGVALRRVASEP
jgi:hypothetical protein